jgi:phospholipid N-methyltransferase
LDNNLSGQRQVNFSNEKKPTHQYFSAINSTDPQTTTNVLRKRAFNYDQSSLQNSNLFHESNETEQLSEPLKKIKTDKVQRTLPNLTPEINFADNSTSLNRISIKAPSNKKQNNNIVNKPSRNANSSFNNKIKSDLPKKPRKSCTYSLARQSDPQIKTFGSVYSTSQLAVALNNLLINPQPTDHILDPCAGHGILTSDIKLFENITSIEIDQVAFKELEKTSSDKHTVINMDFIAYVTEYLDLLQNENIQPKHNKVIMNPPYASSKYIDENTRKNISKLKEKLLELIKKGGHEKDKFVFLSNLLKVFESQDFKLEEYFLAASILLLSFGKRESQIVCIMPQANNSRSELNEILASKYCYINQIKFLKSQTENNSIFTSGKSSPTSVLNCFSLIISPSGHNSVAQTQLQIATKTISGKTITNDAAYDNFANQRLLLINSMIYFTDQHSAPSGYLGGLFKIDKLCKHEYNEEDKYAVFIDGPASKKRFIGLSDINKKISNDRQFRLIPNLEALQLIFNNDATFSSPNAECLGNPHQIFTKMDEARQKYYLDGLKNWLNDQTKKNIYFCMIPSLKYLNNKPYFVTDAG